MKKLLVISFEFIVFFLLFFLLLTNNSQLITVYAQSPGPVDIGEHFGFGNIKSLGEGTSRLVGPFFSIAAFLVILYLLLGAFKYIRAGGNKEDVEAAKQMIVHGIIGFMLLMLTFFVLQFLMSSLFGATTSTIIQSR